MSTLEAIVEELKGLSPPKLAEAANYIHRLRETTREEELAILKETSGAWSGPDGEAIERAIEEGCEKIDPRDWLRVARYDRSGGAPARGSGG